MTKMITSPSTMPSVNVLFSEIAPIMGALVGRESLKGEGLPGATTVLFLGKEDTYVEPSAVL